MGNNPYGIRIRSGAEIEQQARLKKREELLKIGICKTGGGIITWDNCGV